MNETITLFRRGFFVTENFTATQCTTEGHEAYTYQATMLCDYKLDDSGFIVDHTLLHQQIVQHIDNNPMYSCEVMSRQLAHLITDFMLKEGCALRQIELTIIPVKKGQLKREGNSWVAKNPLTINYNMPANAIYKLIVDDSFKSDIKSSPKLKNVYVTKENAVLGMRVIKSDEFDSLNEDISDSDVGTIIKDKSLFPEDKESESVRVLWDEAGLNEDSYYVVGEKELFVHPDWLKENTKSDYKGQIAEFPKEVVEKMLERQVEQGNTKSIELFEIRANRGGSKGGFSWDETPEGYSFWKNVIEFKNFDYFFERYPKK